MFKTIDRPTSCVIINFLNVRNVRPCDIYPQISESYRENALSEGMGQKWIRMFNKGRENVHYEERSGCPLLIAEELVRCTKKKARSNRRFAIFDLISLTYLTVTFTKSNISLIQKLDSGTVASRSIV